MDTIGVFSTYQFSDTELQRLQAISPRLHIRQQAARDERDLPHDLASIEVMYLRGAPPTDLTRFPHLQWLHIPWAGIEFLLDHPVRHSPVVVTNASGVHATPIAEHVFALLLALMRHVPKMLAHQAQTGWPKGTWNAFRSLELRGMTLGIIGYGSIGREVGRLGAAFGMTILACNRSGLRTPDTGWREDGVGDPDGSIPTAWYSPARLLEMLPQCDAVVLAAPLTTASRGLMGREALAAMKPSAYFINIARGAHVDQDALVEALQAGRIAGAGLDVVTPEPLPPDHPLWRMENVILSPHVSASTPEWPRRVYDVFAENLRRYVTGEPLLNRVDWERGY
ncbi:MAG: D-2-hydroxyacid dehydrogenase [Anaerolineae bacterium]|nr:D-2-hydroxyacid dehydrogenase [Anaerolineae bacterium]